MNQQSGLFVVIPALNEAATIGKVVGQLNTVAGQVIVVNDGSKDDTPKLAEAAGAIVVTHASPRGYDASIADGLNEAFKRGAKAAVTCDADGQHRLEDVVKISSPVLKGEVEFCGGIRNEYNRVIEGVIGVLAKPTLGTVDPFCGLKCYGRKLFEKYGPFPENLFIGTLPLVWLSSKELPYRFLPIQTPKRLDQPRFGTTVRASIKLAKAFGGAMGEYVKTAVRKSRPASSKSV